MPFDLEMGIVRADPPGSTNYVLFNTFDDNVTVDGQTYVARDILTTWTEPQLNAANFFQPVPFMPPDGEIGNGDATWSKLDDGKIYEHQTTNKIPCPYLPKETLIARMTPEEVLKWDRFIFAAAPPPEIIGPDTGYTAEAFAKWHEDYVNFDGISLNEPILAAILPHLFGSDRIPAIASTDPDLPWNYNPFNR